VDKQIKWDEAVAGLALQIGMTSRDPTDGMRYKTQLPCFLRPDDARQAERVIKLMKGK